MNLQGLNKLKATLNQPPTYNVGADGCTPESPCDLGVGDCDTAEDCKGDLQCFQRTNGEPVPGIGDMPADFPDAYDVCYDAGPHNKGPNGCTPESPCDIGYGDCDIADDCKGDLQCFQRADGEPVPGFGDMPADFPAWYDVCYDPDHAAKAAAAAAAEKKRIADEAEAKRIADEAAAAEKKELADFQQNIEGKYEWLHDGANVNGVIVFRADGTMRAFGEEGTWRVDSPTMLWTKFHGYEHYMQFNADTNEYTQLMMKDNVLSHSGDNASKMVKIDEAARAAAAEAKRLAAEAETKRIADEAAEAKRIADEAAEAAAEKKRISDAAEAKRIADEAAEVEAKRIADEAAEAAAEKKRIADAAEAKRIADEAAEAEAKRIADEAAEAAAEKKRIAIKAAKAEAKRIADIAAAAKAEAKRIAKLTPERGMWWCTSPTTGESGNCCSKYYRNLDVVRTLPLGKERRPVCKPVATPARGEASCKSLTTGEAGNCCASGGMDLDVVRRIPAYKPHGQGHPICYYEGGPEVGDAEIFEKWRVNFTQAQCHSQGKCNDGYMDVTNGKANWWGCAANCPGGKHMSDGGCYCACVEMPDNCS